MSKKWINHNTNNENAKLNIFCFPHAGSSSTFFAGWVRYFSDDVNIYPVQYPARDNRMSEPMPQSLFELAEKMVDESMELFEKPFIFVGHCSGSIVAYEVAEYLRKKTGKSSKYMFVSASVAPEDYKLKSTKNLSDAMFFKYYNYPDYEKQKDDPLFKFFLPVIRMDFALCERYRYKEYDPLDCPIFAFAGSEDKAVGNPENVNVWKKYTTSSEFGRKVYDGDHFYFERNVEDITGIINETAKKIIAEI